MGESSIFESWSVGLLRMPVRPATHRLQALPGAGEPHGDDASRLLSVAAEDPGFLAMLELASPDLVRGIESARKAGTPTQRQAAASLRRTALAVHRYARRTATRPTPFGLFAGVAPVQFTGHTKVSWHGNHRVVARIDNAVLARITRQLETDPELLPELRVQVHQLVEQHGDRLIQPNPTNPEIDPGEHGRIAASVRCTRPVAAVCELAAEPVAVRTLLDRLRDRFPAASGQTLLELLGTLVAEHILVTDLSPSMERGNPTDALVRRLAVIDAAVGRRAGDAAVRRRLDTLARVSGALPVTPLAAAPELLRSVRDQAPGTSNSPLHVDLGMDVSVRLPPEVPAEAVAAAEVLWRLAPVSTGTPTLREYHAEFVERYGIGRLVPIAEVLDADRGLGAPAGFEWPPSPRGAERSASQQGIRPVQVDRAFAELLAEALRDGRREVVLDEETLRALREKEPDPASAPESFELYLHLVAEDAAAIDRGEFRLVLSPNPGSHIAGATFGRFHDVLPAEAVDEVAEQVRRSAGTGEPLAAALRYETRTARGGNIAREPGWLDARISVGVPAGQDGPEELHIGDIAIGATLEGLYVVHVPSGRRVQPCVFNMLNPRTQAPNAIRLLYELAFEHLQMWAPWDWAAMGVSPFLPRVRYGRTVLWSATWSLERLRDSAGRPAEFRVELAAWRAAWQVPRNILATSNDQRLQLDLEDAWDVELLRVELTRATTLVAQELPGGEEQPDGWLGTEDGGHHVAELTVPVRRVAGVPRLPAPTWGRPESVPDRLVLPGSDWLFLKLTVAPERSDGFVRDRLPRLVDRLRAEGGFDRWFFIRYTDPDYHVRLRLHGDPATLHGRLLLCLNEIASQWRAEGVLARFSVDGYDPELERYGGPEAMAAAERYFEADSEAVVTLLGLARAHGLDTVELAAIGMAETVHAWGWPAEQDAVDAVEPRWRHDVVASWLSTTGSRHDVPAGFRRDRERRAALIDPAGGWAGLRARPWGSAVLDALEHRTTSLVRYREVLRELADASRPWVPESRVVSSLLHMHCNRLLGGSGERETAAMRLARACTLHHAERRRHRPARAGGGRS